MRLKHLGHPLVVGFSTGQKHLHLHYIRVDLSQNKNPKHSSNHVSEQWVLSFSVVLSTLLRILRTRILDMLASFCVLGESGGASSIVLIHKLIDT